MDKPVREIDYNVTTSYVTKLKSYIQDKYCISLLFKNEDQAGQTIATVNGKRLQPPPASPTVGEGEWISWSGNENEFYRGRCDISFQNLDGSVAAAGLLCVTERYYMVKQ